jgi:hypothetical protein
MHSQISRLEEIASMRLRTRARVSDELRGLEKRLAAVRWVFDRLAAVSPSLRDALRGAGA